MWKGNAGDTNSHDPLEQRDVSKVTAVLSPQRENGEQKQKVIYLHFNLHDSKLTLRGKKERRVFTFALSRAKGLKVAEV